jgi:hypothetical protein
MNAIRTINLTKQILLISFVFFLSCKKQTEVSSPPQKPLSENAFFSRAKISANQSDRDLVDTVIDFCKRADDISHFSDAVINKYGYPRWDLTMTLNNENGLKTLFVPVVDSADRVRLIISAYQQSKDKFLFKMIAKDMQQPGLPKSSKDNTVFTSQSLVGIFSGFEKRVIALKNLPNSPNSDIETNSGSNVSIYWECWTESWMDEKGGFFMTNTKCTYTIIITPPAYGSIVSELDVPKIGGGDGDGGGGGGDNTDCITSCEVELERIVNSSKPISIPGTVDVTSIDGFKKNKNFRWKNHESPTWDIYSSEQGVIKLIDVSNNLWQWESLEHKGMTVTGINGIGVDISVKNDNGTPSFVAGSQNIYYAAMEVEYDITVAILCQCSGSTPSYTKHYKNNSPFYSAKP